jgi:hypothetical protein
MIRIIAKDYVLPFFSFNQEVKYSFENTFVEDAHYLYSYST